MIWVCWFHNAIVTDLQNTQFEDILKFLESSGQIWSYELNGEVIWDILISGEFQGSSSKGESISRSLMYADGDLDTIRKYEQVSIDALTDILTVNRVRCYAIL